MGRPPRPGAAQATPSSRDNPPDSRLEQPLALSFTKAAPGGPYCLSHCTKDEVRAVVDALRMFTTLRWIDVIQTGGKDPRKKTGLHYEVHKDHSLRAQRPPGLSPEMRIASFRASQRFRVYGYHLGGVFHVLWFDRAHEICPG